MRKNRATPSTKKAEMVLDPDNQMGELDRLTELATFFGSTNRSEFMREVFRTLNIATGNADDRFKPLVRRNASEGLKERLALKATLVNPKLLNWAYQMVAANLEAEDAEDK